MQYPNYKYIWQCLNNDIKHLTNKEKSASYKPTITLTLLITTSCCALPITLNKENDSVHPHKNILSRYLNQFEKFLILLHSVAMIFRTISSASLPDTPIWRIIIESYYAGIFGILYIGHLLISPKITEVIELMNGTKELEADCIKRGAKDYVSTKIPMFNILANYSIIACPLLMFALAFLKPCMPPLLGSVLFECDGWNSPCQQNLGLMFILGILQVLMWWSGGAFLSFNYVVGFLYPCAVMKLSLESIGKRTELIPRIGARVAALRFRQVQVLASKFNDCWQSALIPIHVGGWVFAEVVALFAIVKLRENLPLIVFAYFVLISVDGFIIILLIFRSFSEPLTASENLLSKTGDANWTHFCNTSKWFRSFNRSCIPIKLKVGSAGYFDELTTLNLWQFCVDQTINLLLM